jgi:nucleotide-binding universal stress UspA family protein
MFKPISSIMFATNLSENCNSAFEFAASLATSSQATLVILHVIEKQIPDYVEGRLKGLLGEEQWQELQSTHEKGAQETLIDKRASSKLIHDALQLFCTSAGIDDSSCGYQSREILVKHGNVAEEIIAQSKKYNCDLIVLGAREGFLASNSIGPTIKEIMRRFRIPVMMVPPAAEH